MKHAVPSRPHGLPYGDGRITATSVIRTHEGNKNTPAAPPSSPSPPMRWKATVNSRLAAGMNDYLTKAVYAGPITAIAQRWLPTAPGGHPGSRFVPAPLRRNRGHNASRWATCLRCARPTTIDEHLGVSAWQAIRAHQRPGQPDFLLKQSPLYSACRAQLTQLETLEQRRRQSPHNHRTHRLPLHNSGPPSRHFLCRSPVCRTCWESP